MRNPRHGGFLFTMLLILLQTTALAFSSSSSLTSSRTSTTTLFGIPKMFRWLTDQYPNINKRLSEGFSDDIEVDNFYLDMNGIIHPCTHGNAEGEVILLDETQMFKKIFLYVDRLYKLVKPRKCLYLAVDGVAPRAKMNQQRSRRFRSAKEAEQNAAEVLRREGKLPSGTKFDSNCITPGTDFMLKLSLSLQKWVAYKMETDVFWQQCGADVVVSGPDVPGEGEHKVMDYIRECKEQNGNATHWGPGWTHVLYGLDADLIMLGLVTHEPRFFLLREKMSVVMAGRGRNRRKKKDMMEYDQNDFELLELKQLRNLLSIQFRRFADEGVLQTKFDLKRIINDFVFMCMLVGNDFLPHCPHLEIDNGAISLMMGNYVELLGEWGGYLTDKAKIHPQRLEQFLYHLAVYEEEHFKRRGYQENEPGWQLSSDHEEEVTDFYGTYYSGEPTPAAAVPANEKLDMHQRTTNHENSDAMDIDQNAILINGAGQAEKKFRNRHPSDFSRSYRDYYYETKLGWSPSKADRDNTLLNRRAHVRDYLEGLHWVLNYYHNGCPSWDWYFPHLYSPLCSDIVNIQEFYNPNDCDQDGFCSFPFDEGEAIPSLAQLLSVLPPQSSDLLPKPLAELMIHPSSPLVKYYPQDFDQDANGKRQPWEAVVQIPFIDSSILLDTLQSVMNADKLRVAKGKPPFLTNAERRRNVRGVSKTFVANVENKVERQDLVDLVVPTRTTRNNKRGAAKTQRSKRTSGAAAARPRAAKGQKRTKQ